MSLDEALEKLRGAKPLLDRYGVARIGVFGSVARGEAGPDSDVDVLVEFKPEQHPGLDFFALRDSLEGLLGVDVDLATSKSLHRLMRDRVMREVAYAQGGGELRYPEFGRADHLGYRPNTAEPDRSNSSPDV